MLSLKTILLFAMVLSLQNGSSDSLRILGMFPFPAKSHFQMFSAVMKELARRGHQVDVVSLFPSKKPIPNYTEIDIRVEGVTLISDNLNYTRAREYKSMFMRHVVQGGGIGPCDSLGHPNMQKILKTEKGVYDVLVVQVSFLLYEKLRHYWSGRHAHYNIFSMRARR